MQENILIYVVILLAVAVTVVVLLRRLRLPTIIAYLVTGLLIGPHGLNWFPDNDAIRVLAEFGVVFLLFTLGLEFSLPRLVIMRREVLVLGGAQVAVTTAAAVLLSRTFDVPYPAAIIIGGAFAMSSTAIVAKQLGEQLELGMQHGRLSVGVLLFQDIAVVAFIIYIASLSDSSGAGLAVTLGLALLKTAIVLVAVIAIGHWLVRPLFHEIARARSAEVFTLAVLLFTLTAAWSTHYFGLSLALGGFLAGMMLGETEFRHQVESDIRPFRDMLLGLYFVTVGMLVDPVLLLPIFNLVLLLTAAIMIFKAFISALLARLITSDWNTATRTGVILAHAGEFSFAIITVAIASGQLEETLAQVALGSMILSMFVAPLMIRFNAELASFVFNDSEEREREALQHDIAAHSINASGHVIICGYGRVGQNVARFLEKENIEYIALDLDPFRVRAARLAGDPIYYGDATHINVLKAAGVESARIIVQTSFVVATSIAVIKVVRSINADIPILVRTRDDSNLDELMDAGATEVVPETLEASLMMASHVLMLLDVPVGRIVREIQDIRSKRYSILRSVFRKQYALPIDSSHALREELYSIQLPDTAYAIGKQIQDLRLLESGIVVTALRRGDIVGKQPAATTVLQDGDTLILFGTPEDLEHAEKVLLNG